ncbi:MAG TPA: DUF4376 domain-containing protein [Alphaproteobacteria bacterium]|nr:DUF4376 domain-containing protein [Alphaproteobacteria bacterium]
MNVYAIYVTATGQIKSVMQTPMALTDLSAPPSGQSYLQVTDGTVIGFLTHQIANPGTPDAALVPYIQTLQDAQTAALQRAADYFQGLFLVPSVFTYRTNPYQIDPASQQNIAAMGSLASASVANPATIPWPGAFYWRDAKNNHQPMTAAQMLTFAVTIANYVSACILRCASIKDGIRAATSIAAIQAIDVTAGYPAASA